MVISELMPGKVGVIFSLANIEIGHNIPNSEWDIEPLLLDGARMPIFGALISACRMTAVWSRLD